MAENIRTVDQQGGQVTVSSSGDIRVVVAEDSATIRYHLVSIIDATPGMRVVGQARDGEEAVAMVSELQPDVVSMDVRMPRMDGMEATRRIMAKNPTPVVIVSGLVQTDIELSFEAIQAGALAVVEKPPDRSDATFKAKQQHLIRTLTAMARVKVIRRITRPLGSEQRRPVFTVPEINAVPELIAIGSSAGGPSALSQLLGALPANLSIPIVIAQHIPHEFVAGLAGWLDKVTPLRVQVATHGIDLAPGVVNLSPGTAHLTVRRDKGHLVTHLVEEQGAHRYQPSVDALFESVAEICGSRAVGIVLTGMGDDGASGLLRMRQAGARTLAQDQASSTVFGMPGAAIERGAVEQVLPLASLPLAVLNLVPRIG